MKLVVESEENYMKLIKNRMELKCKHRLWSTMQNSFHPDVMWDVTVIFVRDLNVIWDPNIINNRPFQID